VNAEGIKRLIAEGESLSVEFKRDDLSDDQLVETIVCFANGPGGWILLGVEDDGRISGIQKPFDPNAFAGLVASRTQPPLHVEVHLTEVDDATVAAIYVPHTGGIYATSSGKYLQRVQAQSGPECRPLYPYQIRSRLADVGNYDYSAQPVPRAGWEDLDPLEFERLRRTIQRNPGADKALLDDSNEQIARALGLVSDFEGRLVPTVAGLLLLGKTGSIRRHLPAHEVAFQVNDADLSMRKNEFTRDPLIKVFERLSELFAAYNPEEEFRSGLFRIDVPRFPPEAFREALANALVHRDYARLNAVYVQIDERKPTLTIQNPGGFPQGVTLENLLSVGPVPRNPVLADAFKRIGIAERRGRGVEKIFRETLRLGRRPPDYMGSGANAVRVVFYGGPADAAFLRMVNEVQERSGRNLDLAHLFLLWAVREQGELTSTDAALIIQQEQRATRRILEELRSLGLIEAKGHARGRKYYLSRGVAEVLGQRAAYTRRRGIARKRQEELVLEHARKFGTIRRKDVLELFPDLSESQATYLLASLVRKGLLIEKGRKGGKHYAPR